MDEDRYNQILTGRSGFFDFGGFTPPPPAPVEAACVVEVINNVPVVSYSDFTNVSTVSIRRNGIFIDLSSAGTGTYEDTSAVPGVAYSYEVRSRPGGVATDVACSPATITVPLSDTQIPTAQVQFPVSDLSQPAFVTVEGSASDDISGVARVLVRVERLDTSPRQYWNGSDWVAAASNLEATVNSNGPRVSDGYSWFVPDQVDLTNEGSYRIRVWARDTAGNTARFGTNPIVDLDVVPGEMNCSVSVINNVPVVSYSDFPDASNVNILRNGGWIVTDSFDTPGAGTYADTSAVPGVAYSYVIRSRPGGGVVNDVACSPATITF
jgi:hypothetical protein